ncbi:MAG TPA: glycosyltransferase N-terminal domain-containing protein [Chlamydiales bacterium]|jgi:3-deoxy-D-manno-octulosonic-acid transferase
MILYNFVVAIGFLCFWPFQLYQAWKKGKQFPSLRQRLGIDIPEAKGRPVVWIHAVSVGEVKAASALAKKLKKNRFLLVTTQSKTGQEEARRSISEADCIAFLPLDFSWTLRRWARRLKPELLVLVEGDFWYNLLRSVKEVRGQTVLVSGRLSPKSASRFLAIKPLAKKLFSQLDLLLLQSEEHRCRFLPFVDQPSKLHVVGNLKLDATVETSPQTEPLPTNPFPIAITCTHNPEEEELLNALAPIESLTIFLAPRHPERFSEVAQALKSKSIPFIRWSQMSQATGHERVILVDSMGQLPAIYRRCQLALLGGSFSSQIGGHNILEPCLYGCPVFFGPHMQNQPELVHHVLKAKAGKQLAVEELMSEVRAFKKAPEVLRKAALALSQQRGSVLAKTLRQIETQLSATS